MDCKFSVFSETKVWSEKWNVSRLFGLEPFLSQKFKWFLNHSIFHWLACSRRSDVGERAKTPQSPLAFFSSSFLFALAAYDFTRSPLSKRLKQAIHWLDPLVLLKWRITI